MSIREQIPIDMKQIEKDWKLPVSFINPDTGEIIDTDAETGEELQSIQILYPAKVVDIEIGEIVNRQIVVVMRRAAMSVIPDKSNYRKWIISIPESVTSSTMKKYGLEEPIQGGESLDFIRFYLRDLEQSS